MTELLLTLAVFGVCMLGMAIGVIARGRNLRGSCGGVEVMGTDGDPLSCGACPKSEAELCPSDDPLVALAQVGHPDPVQHH